MTRDVKSRPEFWVIKRKKMEKRLYIAPDVLLCTCPSQLLLSPGCVCELCMGLIADLDCPEYGHATPQEKFDLSYFEALERLYEDIEFAA